MSLWFKVRSGTADEFDLPSALCRMSALCLTPRKMPIHDLTIGSIPRHMIRFSLPMLAGNLLQVSYGIINTMWVGNFLGKNALTAATNGFSVLFL